MKDDLMSASEVADLFGIKQSAISNLRARGAFIEPAGRVGNRPYWHRIDVEAYGRHTGRLARQRGHLYDAEGYDVTAQYKRRGA